MFQNFPQFFVDFWSFVEKNGRKWENWDLSTKKRPEGR